MNATQLVCRDEMAAFNFSPKLRPDNDFRQSAAPIILWPFIVWTSRRTTVGQTVCQAANVTHMATDRSGKVGRTPATRRYQFERREINA
jgi:hypothetical protein